MFYDEATQILASDMQLLEEGRGELLPSGKQSKFDNCAAWAGTYLDKAGLIETPSRMFPVWLVKKKIAVHPSRNRIIKRKTNMPRYIVTLTEEENHELKTLVQKGGKGRRIKHAQIPLKLDQKPENKTWTYDRIKDAYGVSRGTIASVAK